MCQEHTECRSKGARGQKELEGKKIVCSSVMRAHVQRVVETTIHGEGKDTAICTEAPAHVLATTVATCVPLRNNEAAERGWHVLRFQGGHTHHPAIWQSNSSITDQWWCLAHVAQQDWLVTDETDTDQDKQCKASQPQGSREQQRRCETL